MSFLIVSLALLIFIDGVLKVKVLAHCVTKRRATAAHILSNCYVALKQDRYTWRHDNVIALIYKDIVGIVNKANSTNKRINTKGPTLVFVKEGSKSTKVPKRSHSILSKCGALDWRIDFGIRNDATIPS